MTTKCGSIVAVVLVVLSSATGLIRTAPAEEVVIADFENGDEGFPSLWLSSDPTQKKVGAASGKIRLGLHDDPYDRGTPGTALVHKSLAAIPQLNREVSSIQFWAKSTDIDTFEVQIWDGNVNARKFPVTGFVNDGQWHQVTINLGTTWQSPVTEVSLMVPNQNQEQEKFLWVDQITATVSGAPLPPPLPIPTATRLLDQPLFQPHAGKKGDDTRAYFPSLVKIPDWVPAAQRPDPSAKYYLYWAVHKGGYYIRASWAAELTGPYQEWNPGTGVLRNVDVGLPSGEGDFASPDVHILPGENKLRMFVHSDSTTYVAESTDGLHWAGVTEPTGGFIENDNYYYRAWQHGDDWYAINRGGSLMKSDDGRHFSKVKNLWWPESPAPRHVGVFQNPNDPDILDLFVSRLPTQDEHIEMTRLDMSDPDPRNWHLTLGYVNILEVERDWEGGDLPSSISRNSSEPRVRQLRDPFIYTENGKYYLLYTIQGEQGFGIAELNYSPVPEPGTAALVSLAGAGMLLRRRRAK